MVATKLRKVRKSQEISMFLMKFWLCEKLKKKDLIENHPLSGFKNQYKKFSLKS